MSILHGVNTFLKGYETCFLGGREGGRRGGRREQAKKNETSSPILLAKAFSLLERTLFCDSGSIVVWILCIGLIREI